MNPRTDDTAMLDRAARAALRAAGRVEPNPTVGCVIRTARGDVITARHERFGGPHAEAAALERARRRGLDARGAAVFVTLEPCDHHGKQPPCAQALVEAGVERVVYARTDPHPDAAGGAATLNDAGINATLDTSSRLARYAGAPFARRVLDGRPWTIAKWAQTLDGKLATRAGHSKWISNSASRRDVHRLRARVDAVITSVATVIADDPTLTARGVPVRRVARRVVLDPELETPHASNLVRSANDAPLTILCTRTSLDARAADARRLARAGADIAPIASTAEGLGLAEALRFLCAERGVATALIEAGPRLHGALFDAGLIDEARVYLAPKLLGDRDAAAIAQAHPAETMDHATTLDLLHARRFGDDIRLIYAASPDPP